MNEIAAEEGNASTDERDELRANIWDGRHESLQDVGDEELVGECLNEFETNLVYRILFDIRGMEKDDTEDIEKLHLHHIIPVCDAVA